MKKLTPAQKLRAAKTALFRRTFDVWCRTHKLPQPVYEWRFCIDRRWRFDVAFLSTLCAIEIHGGVWVRGGHVRGQGFLDDREKMATAQRLGWTVFECAPTGRHPNTLYSPAMLAWLKAGT